MDIAKIDPNFAGNANVDLEDIAWLDGAGEPFVLYGAVSASPYLRLPLEVAKTVSEGVYELARHTAGVRLRFRTDSPFIAIHCEWEQEFLMSNMTMQGSRGFDMYAVWDSDNSQHMVTPIFRPPVEAPHGYDAIANVSGKMTDYILNFPLYNDVRKLYIGIRKGSTLKAAPEYRISKPIVYYGSSITQGGCASRPGNTYQSIITRELDCDHVNLGFSGSAKGEDVIAQYIAGLEMSAFVYDYDCNAPTPEHLRQTHERMFKTIRRAHPELPILMLTRPKYYLNAEEEERVAIVKKTYGNAIAAGDQNVYFIPGPDLILELVRETATVDTCHPNDSGFMSMAYVLGEKLKRILK